MQREALILEMKKTVIKDLPDLTHGLYIRAVVNHYGKFWIEYVRVSGKQFKPNPLKGWKVKTPSYSYLNGESYVTDLGVGIVSSRYTQLFRFTNREWLALDALVKAGNVFDFIEYITGKHVHQPKRDEMLADWEYRKWADDENFKLLIEVQ